MFEYTAAKYSLFDSAFSIMNTSMRWKKPKAKTVWAIVVAIPVMYFIYCALWIWLWNALGAPHRYSTNGASIVIPEGQLHRSAAARLLAKSEANRRLA